MLRSIPKRIFRSLSTSSSSIRPPPSSSILSSILPTAIDTSTIEFKERASAMEILEKDLIRMLGVIHLGGGEKAIAKVRKTKGKLLVRERYVLLFYSYFFLSFS